MGDERHFVNRPSKPAAHANIQVSQSKLG